MKILILKYLVRSVLILRYHFHKLTRTGTFGSDGAIPMEACCKKTDNPIKEGLFRHHVKQFHESSCSVASVVCVVNTLLERNGSLPDPPLTQQDILERVRTAHWKERMGPNGYRGKRGLPLDILGNITRSALETYRIPYASIETVGAGSENSKHFEKTLRKRLEEFETLGNSIIIAHFDQGSFLRELNIPHISPVGGFDLQTGRVTLLDVDPSQIEPYEISFARFCKGISTHYYHMFRLFGYGRGGYIHIRLQ
ncbi:phytochelatin synthase family protein [Desulfospira joergensenii]|uniref:phytochelatin synthase family protein n=1 Tax=Desulfospira joergensenii TaxID=53329 RepID=UPI0003B4F7AD|nr:phytochelatin synthase family protein [Desulfospira joergensenii]